MEDMELLMISGLMISIAMVRKKTFSNAAILKLELTTAAQVNLFLFHAHEAP